MTNQNIIHKNKVISDKAIKRVERSWKTIYAHFSPIRSTKRRKRAYTKAVIKEWRKDLEDLHQRKQSI